MEVKPGYRQSDIGVIGEEWGLQEFGTLYAEPSRNGLYKTSEYHGRGTRIVNMGEMFGFEFISNHEMSRVALTTHELHTSTLQDGDLLFGRLSVVPEGAGKCSLVLSSGEPLTFESSIIRVRLNKTKASPLFYYYFFASIAGHSLVSPIYA
jgi:type I restriction enzyme S subunit